MTSEQNSVLDIITYLYENREKLSKDKNSGMHKIDNNAYRVHKSSFIPGILDNKFTNIDKMIANVIDICFHNKGIVWNQPSYWITITE